MSGGTFVNVITGVEGPPTPNHVTKNMRRCKQDLQRGIQLGQLDDNRDDAEDFVP